MKSSTIQRFHSKGRNLANFGMVSVTALGAFYASSSLHSADICYVPSVIYCEGEDLEEEQTCASKCKFTPAGGTPFGSYACDGNSFSVYDNAIDTVVASENSVLEGSEGRQQAAASSPCSVRYNCGCPGEDYGGTEDGVDCEEGPNAIPVGGDRFPDEGTGDDCNEI